MGVVNIEEQMRFYYFRRVDNYFAFADPDCYVNIENCTKRL